MVLVQLRTLLFQRLLLYYGLLLRCFTDFFLRLFSGFILRDVFLILYHLHKPLDITPSTRITILRLLLPYKMSTAQ